MPSRPPLNRARLVRQRGQWEIYRGLQWIGSARCWAPGMPGDHAKMPWALLHASGRIDRFASMKDLRDEVDKL